MKLQILEPALAELDEATQYYERHERDLGESFLTEYGHCLDRISRFPDAWSFASANCRKCLFKRFPYAVVFSVVDEVILVIAIMHLSREPAYWVERV
jgi:hypothetical protein